jgi:FixJ family two-component response regulator
VNAPLIAIVDDDEALCFSLVDLMRSIGYRAESFLGAEAFLASSNLPSFNCVIADLRMPGMSGLELARRLRERRDRIPLILITASSDGQLENEAISAGAACLLRKPLDTATLLDCIERSLLQ